MTETVIRDEASLRDRFTAFNLAYAHRLDDLDVESWPSFFAQNGKYIVTTRENERAGHPIGIINCANRGMIEDRVRAFFSANIFEPHNYNHLLGPVEILGQIGEEFVTRSNFHVVRIMESGRSDLYATGSYHDRIIAAGRELKILERKVVLDSRSLDVLMVIPI